MLGPGLGATISRGQVATALLSSAEYEQGRIGADYLTWLHRPVDGLGLNLLTNALNSGMRDEGLTAIILGSDEFFASL